MAKAVGGGSFIETDAGAIESGKWHHAMLVLDGGTTVGLDALKGYLDGELVGSAEGSQVWAHGGVARIGDIDFSYFHDEGSGGTPGVAAVDGGHGFVGEIDEFRIYNGVLSDSERVALYQRGLTGLVGAWDFEDDLADNQAGQDGVGVGATHVADGFDGAAIELDSGDYIDLPSQMITTESGSVSFWMKSTSSGDAQMIIYGHASTGGADGYGDNDEWHVNLNWEGKIEFFVEGNPNDLSLVGPSVIDGEWHHIAATWASSGQGRLYVDGVLEVDKVHDAHRFNLAGLIRIGGPKSLASTRFYDGQLDELKLYDRVLTPEEISLLANEAPLIDVDIDSDNDDGSGLPESSDSEDQIEADPSLPGKVMYVQGDRVPLVIELPPPLDPAQADLRFTFNAAPVDSDASGTIRLWTSPEGGNYLASGVHAASDLGLSLAKRVVVLWVEGVNASEAGASESIRVELDPDGTAGLLGYAYSDTVNVTVEDTASIPGSVSGYKWHDYNADGIRNIDDEFVASLPPKVVFVIDVSGSTVYRDYKGSPVGILLGDGQDDVNGDGDPQSILDGQIAGFIALNRRLEELALGGKIAIVPFATQAGILDLDLAQGDQGVRYLEPGDGVELALRSLRAGWDLGGRLVGQTEDLGQKTNFEAALQKAIEVLGGEDGVAPNGGGTVVFLSDGFPRPDDNPSRYLDEVEIITGDPLKATIRAFGAGGGASLERLRLLDENANIFLSVDPLIATFGGDAGQQVQRFLEPGLGGWTIYADLNRNAQFDVGEPSTVTDVDGTYTLTGLEPGTYVIREVLQNGWQQTGPASTAHTVTVSGNQPTAGVHFGNLYAPVVDLDIDSDNNSPLAPDRTPEEDEIEAFFSLPGKTIRVNNGDKDGDVIQDDLDGYNADGLAGTDDDISSGVRFTPIVLDLSGYIDSTQASVRFTYPGEPIPGEANSQGVLRLWTKDGGVARSLDDYVEPGREYDAVDLGITADRPVITLYVEAIAETSAADQSSRLIRVDVDVDGAGPINLVSSDSVVVTVEDVAPASISGYVWDDLNANRILDGEFIKSDTPHFIYIADVSGSVNGFNINTRQAIADLNQRLIDEGFAAKARISMIATYNGTVVFDLDPTLPGTQSTVLAGEMFGASGHTLLEERVLNYGRNLTAGEAYEDYDPYLEMDYQQQGGDVPRAGSAMYLAKQELIAAGAKYNDQDLTGDPNVIFLGDGQNGDNRQQGEYAREIKAEFGGNVRAFGIGYHVVDYLRLIDPAAIGLSNAGDLAAVFSGLIDTSTQIEESRLAGWTVYLDENNNDQLDANELAVVTGPDGAYAFSDLPAGKYTVRLVGQPDWFHSVPQNGEYIVTLEPGYGIEDMNFGQYQSPAGLFFNSGGTTEGLGFEVFFTQVFGEGPFLYSFDFNNDGDFTDEYDINGDGVSNGPEDLADLFEVTADRALHVFTDNGDRTVRGRITDTAGRTRDFTTVISVSNVAPEAEITGLPATVTASSSLTLGSVVTDVSHEDEAAGFTYAWSVTKDGQPYDLTGVVVDQSSLTFTPDAVARFGVKLEVTDKDGGIGTREIFFDVDQANQPPVITSGPSAGADPVLSTQLSVTATDDGGASNLTYLWETVARPEGAADPLAASVNNSNAASVIDANFDIAGEYEFVVYVYDSNGLVVSGGLSLTVQPSLSAIEVYPQAASLSSYQTEDFSVYGYDQFGDLTGELTGAVWSIDSGPGELLDPTAGIYRAPLTGDGTTVLRVDVAGLSQTIDIQIFEAPVDLVAPAQPGLLHAELLSSTGADGVQLAWVEPADDGMDPASGSVMGYEILREDLATNQVKVISDPDDPQIGFYTAGNGAGSWLGLADNDGDLVDGRSYRYTIRAFDEAFNYSNPASVDIAYVDTVGGTAAPAGPGYLDGVIESLSAQLSWGTVSGSVSYRVYRSSAGDAFELIASDLSATTYTDSTLALDTEYTYMVKAFDAASGLETPFAWSVFWTGSTSDGIGPGVPTDLAAIASGPQSVLISWQQSNKALAVTSNSTPQFENTGGFRVDSPGMSVGSTYRLSYWARAVDVPGQIRFSHQSGSGGDSNLSHIRDVTTEWNYFTFEVDLDVVHSRLYISSLASNGNAYRFAFDGLKLEEIDANGAVVATVFDHTFDVSGGYYAYKSGVQLQRLSRYGAPDETNPPEATFELERSLDGSSWEMVSDSISALPDAEGNIRYVDQGLFPQTDYYYRVRGIDAEGDSSTAWLVLASPVRTEAAADEGPRIAIKNVASRQEITTDLEVRGYVFDLNSDLQDWALEIQSRSSGGVSEVLATGVDPVGSNESDELVLGVVSATLLPDGLYDLVLSAVDDRGERIEQTVEAIEIRSDLKLGSFSLPATDITIDVPGGLPITISRVYDSLYAKQYGGDFAYGWRWDLQDTQLTSNYEEQSNTGLEQFGSLAPGNTVEVTLPGGRRLSFLFDVGGATGGQPSFVALDGSAAKLVDSTGGDWDGVTLAPYGKDWLDIYTQTPFNPINPTYGGKYRVQTEDGTLYVIDKDGKLESAGDANGNSLSIQANQIVSGSTTVAIERQNGSTGPITRVEDLAGNDVQFVYDPDTGGLLGFVDRALTEPDGAGGLQQGARPTTTYIYADRLVVPIDPNSNQAPTGVYAVLRDAETGQYLDQVLATDFSTVLDHGDGQGNDEETRWFVASLPVLAGVETDGSRRVDITYYHASTDAQIWQETRVWQKPRPYFLVGVIDPRGVVTMSAMYDETTGELKQLIDAFGKEIDIPNGEFDGSSVTQSVTDTEGNESELILDQRGNVKRRITKLLDHGDGTATYSVQVSQYSYAEVDYVPVLSAMVEFEAFEVTENIENGTDRYDRLLDVASDIWTRQQTFYVGSRNEASFGMIHTEVLPALPGESSDRVTTYDDYKLGRAQKVTGPDGNMVVTVFDDEGNQTQTSRYEGDDVAGTLIERTEYEYSHSDDGTGDPLRSDLPAGLLLKVTRYPSGGISEVVVENDYYNSPGNSAVDNRLKSSLSELGVKRFFVYDDNGNQTLSYQRWAPGDADPDSAPVAEVKTVATRSYFDASGRVVRSERYTIDGRPDYTNASQLDSETPDWSTTTRYGLTGQMISSADRFGSASEPKYDLRSNVVENRIPVKTMAGANAWQVTRTAYDANGRAFAVTDPFLLDSSGQYLNPVSEQAVAVSAGEFPAFMRVSHTLYDSHGRVVETRQLVGLGIEVAMETGNYLEPIYTSSFDADYDQQANWEGAYLESRTQTFFDEAGRTEYAVDAAGVASYTEYNADGSQKASVSPAAFTPDGTAVTEWSRIEYQYDAQGRQIAISSNLSQSVPPTDGATAEAVIDRSRQATTYYEYDQQGRQTAVILPAIEDPDDTTRRVRPRMEYGYDQEGRRVLIRENIEQAVDANDDPLYLGDGTAVTNAGEGGIRETRHEYDSHGRLVAVNLPLVSMDDPQNPGTVVDVHPRYEYIYDRYGNQTALVTNAYLNAARDTVVYFDKSDGSAGNDVHEQSRALAAPRIVGSGQVTGFLFDHFNRQTSRSLPQGQTETSAFNDTPLEDITSALTNSVGTGQLEYSIDFEGNVTAYRYDNSSTGRGRSVGMYYYASLSAYQADAADGSLDTPSESVINTYDALGRIVTLDDSAHGITHHTYDERGQLVTMSSPEGTVHYEYDRLGRRIRTYTGDQSFSQFEAIIDNGDVGFTGSPGWSSETTAGYGGDQHRLISSDPELAPVSWTFTGLPSGTYDIYATWEADPGAADSVIYYSSSNYGGVDQTIAPQGTVTPDGTAWQIIGQAEVLDGQLVVQMDTDSISQAYNQTYALADAIRIVSTGQASGQESTLSNDLLAHWTFDEAFGLSAFDQTGNGHDASSVGDASIQQDTGYHSGAADFDGSADAFQSDFVLDPAAGDFSAAAWVLVDNLPGSDAAGVVIRQASGTGLGAARSWLYVDKSVEGNVLSSYFGGQNSRGTTSLTQGRWHHVALTYDLSASTLSLYLDGQLEVTNTNVIAEAATGGIVIGANGDITSHFLDGRVDDARIYGRLLTPEEAAELADTHIQSDTRYAYDSLGRLTRVQTDRRFGNELAAPEAHRYTYDLNGQIDYEILANGLVTDYVYDELDRVTDLHHFTDNNADFQFTAGDTLALGLNYTYHLDGNRASETATYDTGDTARFDWTYDSLNRLVSEAYDTTGTAEDYTQTFAFDLLSNRIKRDHDGDGSDDHTTTYTYDANDRQLTETKDHVDPSGTQDTHTVYQWGADGSATTQTGKIVYAGLDDLGAVQSETTQAYNVRGRMSGLQIDADGDGQVDSTLDYTYNADGLRVTSTDEAGETTTYLFDRNNPTGYAQVLEETVRDAADQVLKQLGYTVGQDVLAQAAKEVLQYVNAQGVQSTLAAGAPVAFLYDLHGNTRALTDDAQAVLQRFAYEAFGVQLNGALLNAASSTLATLLYSGEHTNPVSGLQFLRARFYDPAGGRFNRSDPFVGINRMPQSLNKYSYAHSNPVYYSDPSGNLVIQGAALWFLASIIVLGVLFAGIHFLTPLTRSSSSVMPSTAQGYVPVDRSAVQVHYHSFLIAESHGITEDEVFGELMKFSRLNLQPTNPSGDINGQVGQRINFDMSSFFEAGQADFTVEVTQFQRNDRGRFFVVRTVSGHPLAGWRFWGVRKTSLGIMVETYSVEHAATQADALKLQAGGMRAMYLTWTNMLHSLNQNLGGAEMRGGGYSVTAGERITDPATIKRYLRTVDR